MKDLDFKENKNVIRTQTKIDNTIETVDVQGNLEDSEKVIKEYENCLKYNQNIRTHKDEILQFLPYEHVLIRYYRRLPYLLKDGQFMNTPTLADYAKVTKRADTGQSYTLKEIPVHFKFQNKAVIVKVPPYLKENPLYKEGSDVVTSHVEYAANKFGETTFAAYAGAFIHPASELALPTDDVTNPWYGYALVPKSNLLGNV